MHTRLAASVMQLCSCVSVRACVRILFELMVVIKQKMERIMHKGEEERRSAGDKQLCGRERRRSSRADCKQISGARGRQAMAPASFNAGNRLHPLNVPVETEQRTPCVRLNTERDRDRERGRERESVCVCCVLATHTHTHTHTKHTQTNSMRGCVSGADNTQEPKR